MSRTFSAPIGAAPGGTTIEDATPAGALSVIVSGGAWVCDSVTSDGSPPSGTEIVRVYSDRLGCPTVTAARSVPPHGALSGIRPTSSPSTVAPIAMTGKAWLALIGCRSPSSVAVAPPAGPAPAFTAVTRRPIRSPGSNVPSPSPRSIAATAPVCAGTTADSSTPSALETTSA